MQFNSHPTNQDIVSAVDYYAHTDRSSYSLEDLTRNANKYYKRAVSLIQQSDRNWVWDDRNNTNLPIYTDDLVNGQPDYTIPTDVRDILRIEITDDEDRSTQIIRLNENEVHGSLDEVYRDNGTPRKYQFLGESLYLYPAPNYDATGGIKLFGKRAGSLFETTDTTKEPGFDSQYHDYIAIGAAFEYAVSPRANNQELASRLQIMLKEIELEMTTYYARRGGQAGLSVHKENCE